METKEETLPALRIEKKNQLPDNSQYTNRFYVKSETSDALYTIAQHIKKRHWTCNCPGWIGHRKCKHLTALALPPHEKPFEVKVVSR